MKYISFSILFIFISLISISHSQSGCDSSCLTCSGSSNNQCLTCLDQDYLQGGFCIPIKSEKNALIKAHGIGLLICWSFIVDIGIIVVKYFKHWSNYITIHVIAFIIVDFYTIIIVLCVIAKSNLLPFKTTKYGFNLDASDLAMKFENDRVIQTHFALGVIVLVLVFFQHVGGIVIKQTMQAKKPNMFTGLLSTLKKGHQMLGLVIYLITKATVLVGIWVYDYFDLL